MVSESGHTPVIYDNLSTGHRWAAGRWTLIEADLADRSAIRRAIQDYHVEGVIHFAAHAYVGESVRDYIHVDDLGSAHLLALEYLFNRGPSRGFNLCTGKGHSVRAVLDMVEQVSKAPVPFRAAGRRPGDPPVLIADSKAAREILACSPPVVTPRDRRKCLALAFRIVSVI